MLQLYQLAGVPKRYFSLFCYLFTCFIMRRRFLS
jgi:hypothetical protein